MRQAGLFTHDAYTVGIPWEHENKANYRTAITCVTCGNFWLTDRQDEISRIMRSHSARTYW